MKKDILYKVAERTSTGIADIERLTASLSEIFKESLSDGDSIAIPGFGTFNAQKKEEQIVSDKATGQTLLTPPSIEISFIPALRLLKGVKNVQSHE